VGDTLYGYDELRTWLEEQHKHYVLAIPETPLVWVAGRKPPIGYLAALLPDAAWTVLSAGEGSQGPRLYEWAWFQLPPVCAEEGGSGQARFVLLRRSLSDPSQRAYYRVAGPTTLTLPEVVRIAGRRWIIEEAIEEANDYCGKVHQQPVIDGFYDKPELGPHGEHTSSIIFKCAAPRTLKF